MLVQVSSSRSFVFLWCGSSDGLDLGRLCLQNWGFRRCEDICWIRTNARWTVNNTSIFVPKSINEMSRYFDNIYSCTAYGTIVRMSAIRKVYYQRVVWLANVTEN